MNSKILIIANGPSVLNRNFGDEIDKFEEVARINNYKTKDFQKFTGSKTTVWFNGGNQNLKKNILPPKKVIVFIPYEILLRKEKKIKSQLSKKLDMIPNDFEIIKKEKMKFYEDFSNIKRPTTGFNSIMWSIENYEQVIIHGFDFFQDGKEHYFDSKLVKTLSNFKVFNKAGKHDNLGEKKFINDLIIKNKVINLKDFLKDKK